MHPQLNVSFNWNALSEEPLSRAAAWSTSRHPGPAVLCLQAPLPCPGWRRAPGTCPSFPKNPGSRVRAPSDGNQLGICASHSGTGRLRRPMSRSFSALDVPIRRRMRGEFHRAPQENNATNAPLARDGALDTVHASSGTVVS